MRDTEFNVSVMTFSALPTPGHSIAKEPMKESVTLELINTHCVDEGTM